MVISERSKLAKAVELSKDRRYSLKRIAEETGLNFDFVYDNIGIQRRINPDTGTYFSNGAEYDNYLCKRRFNEDKGVFFKSRSDYEKHMAEKRSHNPAYKAFSNFLKEQLEIIGENAAWLSKETGFNKQMVSLYLNGKALPGKERQKILLSSLGLEDLPDRVRDLIRKH